MNPASDNVAAGRGAEAILLQHGAPVPTARAWITVAGGDFNLYIPDGDGHLRLQSVLLHGEQYPVDRGCVPETDLDGAPLDLWLMRTHPVPPNTWVEVRIIGVTQSPEGVTGPARPILLGVPLVDGAFATVFELPHLPAVLRQAVSAILEPALTWANSAVAAQTLHTANQAYLVRRAHARPMPESAIPLWSAAPAGAAARLEAAQATETVRFSTAEYAFHKIPARFQQDLAHCLLPEERILFFTYRPAFHTRRDWLRRQRHQEGLVVVTDRQVLWLADMFPPDMTMVHWGYNAHAVILERLAEVAVVSHDRHAVLQLTAGSATGHEVIRISFPSAEGPEAARAWITPFVPRPAGRALRRLYRPRLPARAVRWRQEELDLSFLAPQTHTALRDRRDALLAPGEPVLADALAAPIPDLGLAGRLVTVTPTRLIELPVTGAQQIFPHAAVASIEMQYSLWGAALALALPGRAEAVYRIRFNSPQRPWFQDLFLVLGQCLSLPYQDPAIDECTVLSSEAVVADPRQRRARGKATI